MATQGAPAVALANLLKGDNPANSEDVKQLLEQFRGSNYAKESNRLRAKLMAEVKKRASNTSESSEESSMEEATSKGKKRKRSQKDHNTKHTKKRRRSPIVLSSASSESSESEPKELLAPHPQLNESPLGIVLIYTRR